MMKSGLEPAGKFPLLSGERRAKVSVLTVEISLKEVDRHAHNGQDPDDTDDGKDDGQNLLVTPRMPRASVAGCWASCTITAAPPLAGASRVAQGPWLPCTNEEYDCPPMAAAQATPRE